MDKSIKRLNIAISIILLFFIQQFNFAQYTLEQTLGAPYVQSIHSSLDKTALAWVVNEKGARNIWHTSTDNIQPKRLTNYEKDDGLEISQVTLTSAFLFFVRGNGYNKRGQPANPASLPTTPHPQIHRLRIADNTLQVVDMGSGLVISPDGKQLVYTKNGNVYILDDITGDTTQPRLLFEVRSGVSSLTWSPNGNAIAFVSNRDDHSFVGYYSISDKKVSWLSPEFGFDQAPVWSPDGTQIAFWRTPGLNKDETPNLMKGQPFKIIVADVTTGKGQTIWQSPSADGWFWAYFPYKMLQWTKENKILFYSEHEDWNHIYAINSDGTELQDLTPGACEVENNSLTADNTHLYFTSNCEDTNRRHIWKVNIKSGESELLTDKKGIQTNPIALGNNILAYREGTYNQPTTIMLQRGDTIEKLTTPSANFPKSQFVQPQAVTFKSADGLTIHGQLFLPSNVTNQNLPAVIFMHGGPVRQMLLGYHYSSYYANAYIMNQYLASRGYVVLSVNFRTGIGYGRNFRLAENQGPRGASEYKDILAAGKYLQGRSEVDAKRIGLWGGSYGGYLTAMGLAKNSDLFKAGVDLHGVHDWAWRGRDFMPGGDWGLTKALMNSAYHASPVSELQYWSSPVLIISGDDDRNVMFSQSIDLKNKLDKLGVYNESLVFPDEVHGFLRYNSWLKTYESALDFFNRFLQNKE